MASGDQYSPPPSLSSVVITNHSEPQLGQRTVADQSYSPPLSRSDLHHGVGNSIIGGDGDRFLTQIYQAPGLEAVVHENNSTTGFTGYNGYESAPSQSAMTPQNQSNPGGSIATPAFDPYANAGMSINGKNFKNANRILGLYNFK